MFLNWISGQEVKRVQGFEFLIKNIFLKKIDDLPWIFETGQEIKDIKQEIEIPNLPF